MKEDMLKPKNNPFADTRYPIEMDAEIKELDLWGEEFDQYISPFSLAISHGIDEATMNAFVNVGVTVDKEELLKALQYDRNQFAAGFKAGQKAAQPKWISVEERLPGDPLDGVGDVVELLIDKGDVKEVLPGYYDHDEKDWVIYFGDPSGMYLSKYFSWWRVIKWRSLPEPPKEDV